MSAYIVAADTETFNRNQAGRLYAAIGYRNRYVLAAQGTVEQMQTLADSLNGNADD
jgi:hypothetical protein